ncbi:hypothetical protein TNCV_1496091 [Trichonephila clavipes]|nr:hypothetical protein TNCV_1496091 [Trichonephila clavipes]
MIVKQRPYRLFLALADNNLSQIVSNNNNLLLPLSYAQKVTSKNSVAVVSDSNLLLRNNGCEKPPICPLCDLARFHPNFGEELLAGDQGSPTSLPLPPTSREDLWLDGYLEYPNVAKALHLQVSMPSPEFELKPIGTAISVTKHYMFHMKCIIHG